MSNDTSPPADRAENCARLTAALCEEYGAGAVVAAALPRLDGYANPVVTEATHAAGPGRFLFLGVL